jgi:hypothetical protein
MCVAVVAVAEVGTAEENPMHKMINKKNQRKRTFLTLTNMLIRKSVSNSMAEEKVCASFQAEFLTYDVLVTGTLKGFDQLMNLVLDDTKELLRGEDGLAYNE